MLDALDLPELLGLLIEVDGLPNRLLHISSVVVDAELQHLRVGELEGLQHPVELQGDD